MATLYENTKHVSEISTDISCTFTNISSLKRSAPILANFIHEIVKQFHFYYRQYFLYCFISREKPMSKSKSTY